MIRDFYQANKYRNIMTEDMVAFFNARLKRDLTSVFNQYLRHTAVPTLELDFATAAGSVRYRWRADEAGFNMPVKVGRADAWQVVAPTTEWKSMATPLTKEEFQVATDLYYVQVEKR